MDDILIYLRTQDEHDTHGQQVLQQLWEDDLYAKLDKCCFDGNQVEYVVSLESISMDPKKGQSDVQCLLVFANF